MTTHANARGNTVDRRKRRQWLLDTFGNGRTAPCWECGQRVNSTTLCVDRKRHGGSYRRSNIRVHCPGCSTRQGYRLGAGRNAATHMPVRATHSDSIRASRVSQRSIMRELFSGLLIALFILFIFAMVAFHWTYAIPVVIGVIVGTILDARKRGGRIAGN